VVTAESGDPLSSARAGQRWVVRVRLPDGSATDVVGWIDSVSTGELTVVTLDQTRQVVDQAAVLLARRAPLARGAPPPDRVSAVELERRSLRGWLALAESLGEWTLRAAGGFTGRGNSCHAVGDPGVPVAAAAEQVVEFARRHGIAPMAQVITGSEEEQALRALGWTDTYVPVHVMAVRLTELLSEETPPTGVRVTETLEPSWQAAYARSRPNNADPQLLRMILDGNPPRAFASAGEEIIGIARGHLSGDWLGLASVWTSPDHRRRGWATRLSLALGDWAGRRGARYAYLQVDVANDRAIRSYQRLGFTRHHGYLYLAPPEAEEPQLLVQRTRSVGL
jgi:ribosomal protein S18 acetylase RimI-like enzyme